MSTVFHAEHVLLPACPTSVYPTESVAVQILTPQVFCPFPLAATLGPVSKPLGVGRCSTADAGLSAQ